MAPDSSKDATVMERARTGLKPGLDVPLGGEEVTFVDKSGKHIAAEVDAVLNPPTIINLRHGPDDEHQLQENQVPRCVTRPYVEAGVYHEAVHTRCWFKGADEAPPKSDPNVNPPRTRAPLPKGLPAAKVVGGPERAPIPALQPAPGTPTTEPASLARPTGETTAAPPKRGGPVAPAKGEPSKGPEFSPAVEKAMGKGGVVVPDAANPPHVATPEAKSAAAASAAGASGSRPTATVTVDRHKDPVWRKAENERRAAAGLPSLEDEGK